MIDRQFNTTDVAIVVKTDLVTDEYYRHYERRAARARVQPPHERRVSCALMRIAVYLARDPAADAGAGRSCCAIKSPRARRLPLGYHRLMCRVLGIRPRRSRHELSTHRPTLFVANHTSYLDIEIMGAAIEGSFVAKAEVARWPIFGWLAKLQRTIFVERADRAGAARQRDEIRRRLDEGDNLILFPEGTSGDGIHVLPFKSTLFAAAEDERVRGAADLRRLSAA